MYVQSWCELVTGCRNYRVSTFAVLCVWRLNKYLNMGCDLREVRAKAEETFECRACKATRHNHICTWTLALLYGGKNPAGRVCGTAPGWYSNPSRDTHVDSPTLMTAAETAACEIFVRKFFTCHEMWSQALHRIHHTFVQLWVGPVTYLEEGGCNKANSCLQTCMTYTISECRVNKLLMMDRRPVRNM